MVAADDVDDDILYIWLLEPLKNCPVNENLAISYLNKYMDKISDRMEEN